MTDPQDKNKYFPQGLGPQFMGNTMTTFDKMQAEMINIYGTPMDYYPVEVDVNKDIAFGEDTTKRYMRVHKIKGKIDNDGFDENLLYTGFGELNNIEFRIFVHLPTFFKLVGREPMAGDQFYMPFNSTFVYEVSHAVHAALGREGNIFGFKSMFVLNCRERAVTQHSAGYGERFGVVDSQGNLRPDAPADALVNDGSGRIAAKYDVQQPQVSPNIMHDNDGIKEAVDGTGQGDGIAVPRSDEVRSRWGNW
jgi:predicted N-acetyltransferase YhbS